MEKQRINKPFFRQDVLEVAPLLLGKTLCRHFDDGHTKRFTICEVEAYKGSMDLACHASKGKTQRTQIMFDDGGHIYMYLIYGMYWMLNFVTATIDEPQAVLIRGLKGIIGPGKLTKALQLNKSFYGENLETSSRIWLEDAPPIQNVKTSARINIDYAGEPWVSKKWRWYY